jgi:hypothetical protein
VRAGAPGRAAMSSGRGWSLRKAKTYDQRAKGLRDQKVKGLTVLDLDGTAGRASAWEAEYGSFWHFDVRDGAIHHGSGHAYVFAVAPRTVFGFGKGEPFSQTRWRFE